MLVPLQSLHPLLWRLCSQMLLPPQSLHWILMREDHLWATETDMEMALDNTCGPLQLCLDRPELTWPNQNPGPSFDNLATSIVTLVQALSSDGDIDILWASYQSAPANLEVSGLFYLTYGFAVIHVLINVLVAVFANVFASCREDNVEKVERRRQGKTAADVTPVHALSLTLLLPDTYTIGVSSGLKLHLSIAVLSITCYSDRRQANRGRLHPQTAQGLPPRDRCPRPLKRGGLR